MIAGWYEEIALGDGAEFGAYTFTRERTVAFARTFDPQPFHLDEEAARQSHFGALCASGWHTAAAYMKCVSAYIFAMRKQAAAAGRDLPPLGPSPGFENLRWPRPVFVGDTVTYSGTVTGKRELASRPEWGLVASHIIGVNQNGEQVFLLDARLLVARRNGR